MHCRNEVHDQGRKQNAEMVHEEEEEEFYKDLLHNKNGHVEALSTTGSGCVSLYLPPKKRSQPRYR